MALRATHGVTRRGLLPLYHRPRPSQGSFCLSFFNFLDNTVVRERNLVENGLPIEGEKAAVSEQVVGRVPWSEH